MMIMLAFLQITSITLFLLGLSLLVSVGNCFTQKITPNKTVIVTGAGGRTGKLIFKSLLKNKNFDVVGLVRTEHSAKKLVHEAKCGLENIWVSDVTKLDPAQKNKNIGLPKGLSDAEAMIICTSAVPKIVKRSVAMAFFKIPLNVVRRKKIINFRELRFRYAQGQYPEKVDYEGQIAQIELAKRLGISHVILVSSMGGTNKYDFLNTIGKDKNGNGNGDILIYKRKAEKYLVNSGLHYTIIHPGGLRDTPGGVLNLKLDVNDNLQNEAKRSISRCDVARLCVASLSAFRGQNASFDCINCEVEEGSKAKTADEAIQNFLQMGKIYDYTT